MEIEQFWEMNIRDYFKNTECVYVLSLYNVLVHFEVTSPQDWSPLYGAKGVCPPLLSPPSFEMESIGPPKGGGGRTWSEDVQPPQEKLCLAAHGPHGQRLPE